MARYTGPKTKKARAFGEAIYGYDKSFERKKYRPGQHGNSRRRRQQSDYALQLMEKQKAKYTYGVLSVSSVTCLKVLLRKVVLPVRYYYNSLKLVLITLCSV